MKISKYQIQLGEHVKLHKFNPDDCGDFQNKNEALEKMQKNIEKIVELQYKLYAENKQSLLIVLQAMDSGGKDGTINHVFAPLNPQGCRVQSFKVPSTLESSHDFLWRYHMQAPKRGEIVIFNRSQYEQVLVVKVHNLAPHSLLKESYTLINNFELNLATNHTKILKFYLHIDKNEQLKRFISRLDDPSKHWKISANDYTEREYFDQYIDAFEVALSKCSTEYAPWFVIPANNKWYRDYLISEIVLDALQEMDPQLPEPSVDIDAIRKMAMAELNEALKK